VFRNPGAVASKVRAYADAYVTTKRERWVANHLRPDAQPLVWLVCNTHERTGWLKLQAYPADCDVEPMRHCTRVLLYRYAVTNHPLWAMVTTPGAGKVHYPQPLRAKDMEGTMPPPPADDAWGRALQGPLGTGQPGPLDSGQEALVLFVLRHYAELLLAGAWSAPPNQHPPHRRDPFTHWHELAVDDDPSAPFRVDSAGAVTDV
jgi:hypothetical protein